MRQNINKATREKRNTLRQKQLTMQSTLNINIHKNNPIRMGAKLRQNINRALERRNTEAEATHNRINVKH